MKGKVSINDTIRVEIHGHLSHYYTVETFQGKAVKLKLSEREVLIDSNHSSFWIPRSALLEKTSLDHIRSYTVLPWFEKVASRAQLLSLGKKL